MNIGIDIGNILIKTSEKIMFEGRISTEKPFMSECESIVFNGVTYYIEQGRYEHKPMKYDRKNYLPLLATAICKSSDDDDNNIVVGLPIKHYQTNSDELKDFISKNKKMKVVFEGKERHLKIKKFDVYPEGVAIFNTLPKEILKELDAKDVLIIDIGSKTTDCAIFKYVNGKRIVVQPNSLFVGTHNVYNSIRQSINDTFKTTKTLEDAIDVFNNKALFINGEKQNISFLNDVVANELEKIIDDLNLEYNLASYQIVLCGGGSTMMGHMFKEQYPSALIVSDIFANANGYKIIADARF